MSRCAALFMALAATLGMGPVMAQDYSFGWNPRSGDVWVDTWLSDVNRYGGRYRDPFVDEMVRYYGAPRDLVNGLLVDRRWAPGDVYFACAIASTIGRPCRYVADIWERDHAQGWGVVAQNLGIKPGSPEFHRLKKGFVPSYDRWGRSITLDADLQRDFPGRGKGVQGKEAKHGKSTQPKAKPAQAPGGKSANEKGQGQGKGKPDSAGKDKGNAKGNGKG